MNNKKTLWIVVTVIVVALGIGGIYLMRNNGPQNTVPSQGVGQPNLPLLQKSPSTPHSVATVKISDFAFSPSQVKIKTGETVFWTNTGVVDHTATSDSGYEISSPVLAKGASYAHAFGVPGTYTYHCTKHPSMKGTVVVK